MFRRLFKKNITKEQRFFKELELMQYSLDILDLRRTTNTND